jgi:hypothetical protein
MKEPAKNSPKRKVVDNRRIAEESPELETARKLRRYADDLKLTILEYARVGFEVHFEVRFDMFNTVTNLTNTEAVLTEILKEIDKEHPERAFSKCPKCQQIHFKRKSVHIVPLGRAAGLFPNGSEEEKTFFDKHVKMNSHKYLCDNWLSWSSIMVDTKGYPQLCYSNVALTEKARTTEGPNLYDDGFESIRRFYIKVWEDRIDYLKNHLSKLVRSRPNSNYCPFDLFKQTLNKFPNSKK